MELNEPEKRVFLWEFLSMLFYGLASRDSYKFSYTRLQACLCSFSGYSDHRRSFPPSLLSLSPSRPCTGLDTRTKCIVDFSLAYEDVGGKMALNSGRCALDLSLGKKPSLQGLPCGVEG